MFDAALLQQLDTALKNSLTEKGHLYDAMRYSLFAGGKRFRGGVVLQLAQLLEVENALPVAVAVEYLHTYSLIHDDLPAMDNATLRRGQPTNHLKFDEATAILAGDALLTDAFEIITECNNIDVIKTFAQATGSEGMVQGQMLDMLGETQEYTVEQTAHMQSLKTGALIAFCFESVGLLKGDVVLSKQLRTTGEQIGQLFQLTDDLLDMVGDSGETGKDSGLDERAGKAVLSQKEIEQKIDILTEYMRDTNIGVTKVLVDNLVRFLCHRSI